MVKYLRITKEAKDLNTKTKKIWLKFLRKICYQQHKLQKCT